MINLFLMLMDFPISDCAVYQYTNIDLPIENILNTIEQKIKNLVDTKQTNNSLVL